MDTRLHCIGAWCLLPKRFNVNEVILHDVVEEAMQIESGGADKIMSARK